MDDFDFDFGDPTAAVITAAAKTSRFQPKLKGGKQTKPSLPKPEPEPEPLEIKERPIPIPKIEKCEIEKCGDDVVKDDGDGDAMQLDGDDGFDDVGVVDGDMETEDDVVVKEIDVFLSASPIDDGASMYIMQYPLRPSWRPYDLMERERCEEVRVKPKQSKVEVDLRLDYDSEIYDQELATSKLQKQTLSSFGSISISNFAVGIRIGNQLHLNPVDASVQLRPSITCINVGGQRTQCRAPNVHADTNPSEGKALPGDSNEEPGDAEPWVSLEYHSIDSSFWDRYQRKMVDKKNSDIQLAIKQSDYISFLCPGTSSDKKRVVGPSRRVLLLMPLEERFKKWLSEGLQVNRFTSLLYLAPTDPVEEVLKVLQKYADLVQGLWVSKSSLLCEGVPARARDYILSLFSKNCVIRYDAKRLPAEHTRSVLDQFAVHRPTLKDWKFKEPTDFSFIKSYPNIVKEQEFAWSGRVKQLMTLHGTGKSKDSPVMDALIKSLNPHLLKKTSELGKDNHAQKNGMDKRVGSKESTLSNGTRENLIKALLEIFQLHSVRSLNSIIKEINTRINVPTPELQSVLSEVAVDIHGVYILKSLRNPDLDPLRNFVIGIFRQKKANVKFREQDVRKAAQTVLKRNISDSEFNQVINELCTSKGGLMLKSGDSN